MRRSLAAVLTVGVLVGAGTSSAVSVARAQQNNAGQAVSPDDLAAAVYDIYATRGILSINTTRAVISLRTEERAGTEVTVSINSDVLFDFDSADLTEFARREIEALSDRIRNATGVVRVDGYTDNVGAPDYNMTLSQQRATAVADALRPSVQAGATVTAVGHGEADPVAPNTRPDGSDDPAGRALNRRVTVTFEAA